MLGRTTEPTPFVLSKLFKAVVVIGVEDRVFYVDAVDIENLGAE